MVHHAREAAAAAEGNDMKSQARESGAGHAFRLAPHSKGKAMVGVAAMVAVSSFAFLVFGPLADQRALALAGYEPRAAVAASAPPAEERLARMGPREFFGVR